MRVSNHIVILLSTVSENKMHCIVDMDKKNKFLKDVSPVDYKFLRILPDVNIPHNGFSEGLFYITRGCGFFDNSSSWRRQI